MASHYKPNNCQNQLNIFALSIRYHLILDHVLMQINSVYVDSYEITYILMFFSCLFLIYDYGLDTRLLILKKVHTERPWH